MNCAVSKLTDCQLSYFAGIIDGEGSLESQKQFQKKGVTPRYSLRLSLTMSTKEPIKTLAEWLGLKYKVYPSQDEKRSQRVRLHIPKSMATRLLGKAIPFLILKKRQAELIIEIDRIRSEASPSRSLPMGQGRRMPAYALAQMEAAHVELRSLKTNKRPGPKGWPKKGGAK